ncbi:MAG TPA: N-6 DNA methylase [Marmoricola sp.]
MGVRTRATATMLAVAAIERAGSSAEDAGYDDLQRGLYRALLTRLLDRRLPRSLLPGPVVEADVEIAEVADLGRIHEELKEFTPMRQSGALRLVPGHGRRAGGAFYTPPALIEHLLDTALEPVLASVADVASVTVCDPTCGSGLFLVAAARRISARMGGCAPGSVRGMDLDPVAVDLARAALWVEAGCPDDFAPFAAAVTVGDALADPWTASFDVVVGNPPFLNQLERATALDQAAVDRVRSLLGAATGAYTDVSGLILLRALDLVRPGGRVALVQPQSLLAARDAAPVRERLLERASLVHLWASDTPVFEGASVLTCAPTLVVGGEQGPVSLSHGPGFAAMRPVDVSDGRLASGWSGLLAEGLGVPPVELSADGVLGDIAACTADFRDQYYGLVPYVSDGPADPDHARLITSGLIDPAVSLWGEVSTRFAKERFASPVVDVRALPEALDGWASRRLVPKLLVATQSRVIEAVVDAEGEWLPSVPVITVVPPPDRLWHVLAVLCAPPVTAHAATRWAGAGLTMHAIKLSAKQVASLPLPADATAWDEGADLARRAQHAASPAARDALLRDLARVMTAAYSSSDEVLIWWLDRARLG